jgi:hypothetical protein
MILEVILMVAKKAKKTEMSWDEIGKAIGKKIESAKKEDTCKAWSKEWFVHKECGGGFIGRVLLAIGLIVGLNAVGALEGFPTWTLWFMGIGFALMKL